MSYDHWVSDSVQAVETVGAGILVLGGLIVFGQFVADVAARRSSSYRRLRRNLGRVIGVGLEILVVADIVRTIIVVPSFESVAVLATVVLIRIILSWAIEVEVDGTWPWRAAASADVVDGVEESDESAGG